MIFEDDETLHMYVEESLEHLADIENDLIVIEENGENIDEELVNNVFRAAHSIKGGAGFMGLKTIKDISHNLENILGLIRSREIVPTSEVISILLKSFDKLRDLINNVQTSNEEDVSEYIDALVNTTTASLGETEKESVSNLIEISHPDTKSSIEAPQFSVDQAVKEGKYIYLIEYDLIHDIQKKDKTPLDVITSLLNTGTIIETKIDFLAVGTLDDELPGRIPFIVLFASIIEPDMVPLLSELDEKFIHTINVDIISGKEPAEAPYSAPDEAAAASDMKTADDTPSFNEPYPEPEPPSPPAPEPVAEPLSVKAESPSKPNSGSPTPKPVETKASPAQTSLRVNVNLLDTLMTLAGELVLSRNQLLQGISAANPRATEASSQRIDMITSELQEAIMQTRMQPISNIFTKFTRVVRDLAQSLGKQVELTMEGKEVELDKTIIEAINDPLTHLVRNAVDHGLEDPETRRNTGKNPVGKVMLKAYHEAGQVNIEIEDDGKGLNGDALGESAIKKGLIGEQEVSLMSEKEKISLIFLPGFSTAKEITDVSGRGVGMDVVKTNLDKLGGIIDIDSTVGVGTVIRIKLPLTLAIIPSQIISVGKERYAIPQVNLNELLRIPAAQVKDRIEKVGDADVVRLRGTLLPLLNLAEVLGIEKFYTDPESGEEYPDRRSNISDRRKARHQEYEGETEPGSISRSPEDRRFHSNSAINIAVVSAGNFKYGLVVDELRDSEEIVVKPLGRHMKDCSGYAGATIMGDGKVALILDVASLAQMAQLTSIEASKSLETVEIKAMEALQRQKDQASLLLFRNTEEEQFAAPLNLVERIERINTSDIENVGGKRVIQYRGGTLPLYELSEVANIHPLPERDQIEVIVFKLAGNEIGLMVTPPVDAVEVALEIDDTTLKQQGIMGSIIIGNRTTLMVDIYEVVKTLNPEWFNGEESHAAIQDIGEGKILFAEDSAFFRNQVKGFLNDDGYNVITAEDGLDAWQLLEEHSDEILLVLTDLEMPNMNGFELTKKIKGDERFSHLKVIALTSLAGEGDMEKGKMAGIDDYQVKLDREKLLESIAASIAELKTV